MLYSLQLVKKKIQPLWPINLGPPIRDLTLQAPASDVTKRDTGLSPAQTSGHPPNPAPLAQWGHWKKDCPQTLPIKSQGPPQAQQQWAGNQIQGGPGTQTMVPRLRWEMMRDDSIVPELLQWWNPSSRPQIPVQMNSELWVIGTVAGHKVSFLRHWSGLFTFNLLLGPSPTFRSGHRRGLRHPFLSQNNPSSLFLWQNNTNIFFYSSSSMPNGIDGTWSSG